MKSKVRILQLLCPSRHCILATYYESPDGAVIPEMRVRLLEKFADFQKLGLNPWCGICRSRNLRVDDQATVHATIAEAEPAIRELAARQAVTRKFFQASKS